MYTKSVGITEQKPKLSAAVMYYIYLYVYQYTLSPISYIWTWISPTKVLNSSMQPH